MVLHNVQALIKKIATQLTSPAVSQDQALYEAWLLLEKVTGKTRVQLLISSQPLTQPQEEQLEAFVRLRTEEHKPLAYILGDIPFAGLMLNIKPPILIPRPETEEMVLSVIDRFQPYKDRRLKVLDLCSGSGCIGLALAVNFPQWNICGVDINPQAIALAEENKQKLQVHNIRFYEGSLFSPTADWLQEYDVVLSNPPYIQEVSRSIMSQEVLKWEDEKALFAQHHGWAFYEQILALLPKLIRPSQESYPQLIIEYGVDQEDMYTFLLHHGLRSIEIHRDHAGINRWATARI